MKLEKVREDLQEIRYYYTHRRIFDKANEIQVRHAVEGKDFDFTLDGQAYSFQAETNLTGGFDIEYGEESFTVTPKGGVDDVLKGVYPNNEIGDCEGKGYADMYSLVITSYNGEATVTVHFSAYEEVCEITLDKEVIVF